MTTAPTSYDRVPYTSVAYPQTHPDRMATVARVFGLHPPLIASCRVLELGCASGGNLLPLAMNLPESRIVGIDLSREQINEGRLAVAALGLRNLRLEHAGIEDVDSSWGEFDYIICHGVFSWVEPPVREAILRVAAENLAPNGVAYVSYNTYPGWHMRQMVRDMMRYHVEQFDTPAEQVEQARALLAFLASAANESSPYGQMLNDELERLARVEDSYLYHEHLEQTNAPLYFHEFMAGAERAGLIYLSEASVPEMILSHLPAQVAETLERISPDLLHLEQYLDFVRNRQFRQTLLCRRGVTPTRMLMPDVLEGLLLSSPARPERQPVDLRMGHAATFVNGRQRADASLPASKAAFAILGETWPEAMPLERLCELALERAAPYLDAGSSSGEARRALMGDLFGGVVYGMLRLHTLPVPCTNQPAEAPRGHPMCAFQVQRGPVVANAHHENVRLEPLEANVLRLCDGSRTRGDILRLLEDRSGAVADSSTPAPAGATDAGAPDTTPLTPARLDEVIATLTRHAVFVS